MIKEDLLSWTFINAFIFLIISQSESISRSKMFSWKTSYRGIRTYDRAHGGCRSWRSINLPLKGLLRLPNHLASSPFCFGVHDVIVLAAGVLDTVTIAEGVFDVFAHPLRSNVVLILVQGSSPLIKVHEAVILTDIRRCSNERNSWKTYL